jgi:hypothetical protein
MVNSGDPLSDASFSEIWGTFWGRYLAAFGLGLVTYDCLLTLDDEVGLNSTYLTCFILFVRRSALFGQGPLTYQKFCITLTATYPLSL